MKPTIVATLGGAVFAVVLGGYLVSYATTVRDPVQWQSGDMIVLNATDKATLPLFAADGTGMTHIGLVDVRDSGPVVIEAVDKVVATPMHTFLERGKDGAFSVYRVTALSGEQRAKVVAAALRQLGKPNDFFLRRSWDALYSSELVRLAYGDIGFDLGRMQRFSKVSSDLGAVRALFSRNWASNEECAKRNLDVEQCWTLVSKQEVITPAAIVADAHVSKVYETQAEVRTFAFTPAKPEQQAPAAN